MNEGVMCGQKAQIGQTRTCDLPLSIASVPNAVGLLNFTQTSSDAWDDVPNFGELFGKAQRATLRKNSKPIITAHSQKSELSAGRTELAFPS